MTMMLPDKQAGAHFKVLIIEDNPDDRELYRHMLKKRDGMDFEVFEADNVRDGLALGVKNKPDCILIDYQLPDASGIEFISHYKNGGGGDAAIVMVTGQGNEATAAQAMRLGALDYITKTSILEGFFIQSILNAVERARLKDQIQEYQLKLEKTNQELSEFAATASHDLKAPLRRVASYCEFLQEEGKTLSTEAAGYIGRMTVNITRMQKLIDDLLAYSVATRAEHKVEEVDLNTTAADVLEDLGAAIRTSAATVTFGTLPQVPGLPVRLKQLFQNLIGNAIKYKSDAAPVIFVTCEEIGTHYLFSVQDNGMGIEEKFLEDIFKPFQRLHTQQEFEGSGLGLSICRKVVEMHGGIIWAESNPAGGTIFRFTISKV